MNKLGDVYELRAPLGLLKGYKVLIGTRYEFKEVNIKSVKLTLPQFYYGGGTPHYIKVDFTFEMMRQASSDLFKTIFVGSPPNSDEKCEVIQF